jgi:hypothetical protein
VHVIGHQDVSVQRAFGLALPMQVAVVIFLGKETRLAVVTTPHDVERNAIEVDAWAPRHSSMLLKPFLSGVAFALGLLFLVLLVLRRMS